MKKCLIPILLCLFLLAGCGSAVTAAVALSAMSAYPETMHLTEGASDTIEVVLTPSDASDTGLVWASSNRAVAVVDESGMVSALSEGSCTITIASKEYSDISCHVEVIVDAEESEGTAAPTNADHYVSYIPETNAASIYPTYYLSEAEVEAMDGEQLQFLINQIYAKNGYVFNNTSIQQYFSQMPWYVAVSNDTSHLHLSSLDQSNLNLLVRVRDSADRSNVSSLGWIWSRYAVDNALTDAYVQNLSAYDIQLLINTIYAKNGYIFERNDLQTMFEDQPWYTGQTRDSAQISFSSLDRSNLSLLMAYR